MSAFFAFAKKELIENSRTYRLPIMLAVFMLFGLMNPLVAHLMPEILSMAGDSGITITMPDPTAMDSWTQFFSNVGQMGILVLIIVFAGLTSGEFSRGTLINLLTKGLKRSTVILSKYLVASAIWAASYLICFAVTYFYTAYFWDMPTLHHALFVFGGLWLFGQLVLALLVFGGILTKNITGALFSCGGFIIAASLISLAPVAAKYNPISLAGATHTLLSGQGNLSDFLPAFAITAGLIIALITATILIFNKKQI
ncbi:ABC transporter permease [Candidatus Saccharibacteria bacterium]|nr:ABC transporter permease [Candidatus Saccharibacteria bacterium]